LISDYAIYSIVTVVVGFIDDEPETNNPTKESMRAIHIPSSSNPIPIPVIKKTYVYGYGFYS